MKWFRDNKIKVLIWPGNSPDMNHIENLWDILKHEIYSEPTNKTLTTNRELVERQIKVWFCRKWMTRFNTTFIERMPNRIKALTAPEGGQTKC